MFSTGTGSQVFAGVQTCQNVYPNGGQNLVHHAYLTKAKKESILEV